MIAWEESGSGRPALFVHGLTESRRMWDTVVPFLEGELRCVRLDLRGHGQSGDADDYSALAMVADLATVVEEAGLDEPLLVIGHSLGAMVATAYASQTPVRGVVNVDQSLRLGDFGAALAPLAELLRGDGFAEAIALAFSGLGHDGVPEAQVALLDRAHRAARREVVLGVWGQVLDSAPDDLTALAESLLHSIGAPYLAIHGSDPGSDYASWLEEHLPSATVEGWRGGHYPHLADPERFAARVLAFSG